MPCFRNRIRDIEFIPNPSAKHLVNEHPMRRPVLLSCLLVLFVSKTLNAIDVQCGNQLRTFNDCIVNNTCESRCGGTINININVNTCAEANATVCNTFSCCSECFNPTELYYECSFRVFGITCDFECNPTDVPTFTPTAVQSDRPSLVPSTNPSNAPSKTPTSSSLPSTPRSITVASVVVLCLMTAFG